MAYTSGTASSYTDLLAKLEAFLTTNSALVAAGQNWTTQRYSTGISAQAFPLTKVAFSNSPGGVCTDTAPGGMPTSNFKIKVTGQIVVPTTGSYTFGIDAATAGEIIVDGTVVVGVYGTNALAGAYTHTGTTTLTAGTYNFEARVVVSSGVFGLAAGWMKPGDGSVATIPAANLTGLQYQWGYQASIPSSSSEMAALWTEKELILKAPGLSGTESIYVGIQPFSNVASDYYNWKVNGFTGYSAAADYTAQPGISPNSYLYLWNSPMSYWFVANGQRVIVVAKVSTTYQVMYLGKFMQYGLPAQYPYPLFIAASDKVAAQRWSANSLFECSNFSCPGDGANLFYVDSSWKTVRNRFTQSGNASYDTTSYRVWPNLIDTDDQTPLLNSLSWPDTSMTVLPFILYGQTPANVFGELDGAFWVTGHQNSSENIITINGDNYLCVQNISRTGPRDYMAVRLK